MVAPYMVVPALEMRAGVAEQERAGIQQRLL